MALAPSLTIFRHRAYLQFWLMRVAVAAARQTARQGSFVARIIDYVSLISHKQGETQMDKAITLLISTVVIAASFAPAFYTVAALA